MTVPPNRFDEPGPTYGNGQGEWMDWMTADRCEWNNSHPDCYRPKLSDLNFVQYLTDSTNRRQFFFFVCFASYSM